MRLVRVRGLDEARRDQMQQAQAQQAQAQQTQAAYADTTKRALATCLGAKGYSVN